MARCAFCETESRVKLAVVEVEGQREVVDACGSCAEKFGLTTKLTVADLPYPRGGGDLQPELTGPANYDEMLFLSLAVNDLGARVSKFTPLN